MSIIQHAVKKCSTRWEASFPNVDIRQLIYNKNTAKEGRQVYR